MTDTIRILCDNLRECFRQIQRYAVLSIGAAISYLAVAGAPIPPDRSTLTVPGIMVPLDVDLARMLLLATYIVSAAMAGYVAETGNRIANTLRKLDGAILEATLSFPSVGSSPIPAVRFAVSLLPMLLLAAHTVLDGIAATETDWFRTGLKLVFVLAPGITLFTVLPVGRQRSRE